MNDTENCIFCKIVAREIPSEIIYEDEEHLAFLDISPTVEGMTVVIPKKHYSSDFYSNDKEVMIKAILAAKNVASLLQEKLGCYRILTQIEGLEIAHLHIKLIPFYGDKATNEHYQTPDKDRLKQIADKIRS